MNDARKTKAQLIRELAELRLKVVALDAADNDRTREEAVLRESEELHRITMENIVDPVFITDDAGRFTFICPNVYDTLGYSVEEMQQMETIAQFLGTELFMVNDLETRGEIRNIEHIIVDKDGCEHIFLINVKRVSIKRGTLLYTCRDITERKQAEQAIRKERDQAQLYLSIAGVMICRLNAEGQIMMMNAKGCDILGYTETEILHKNWFEVCLPTEIRQDVAGVFHHLMAGEIATGEYYENPVLTKRGEQRIIAFHNTILRDQSARIVGILFSGEDVTERKQAEEALHASERRLHAILNNSPAVIYLKNPAGQFLLVNRQFEKTFHVTQADVCGKTDYDFMPHDLADDYRANDVHILQTGQPMQFEESAPLEDGVHTVVSVKFPIYNPDGSAYGVCGISTDITDRKNAEKQIREHNRLLEHAVQEKQREMEDLFERLLRQEKLAMIGQMAGSIAHELRNPLGAVKNSVFYLKRLAQTPEFTASNPKVLRHLDLMDTELHTAARVIADLLDMTRMKPPQRVQTDLRALVEDAVQRAHLPEQVHVKITLEPAPFMIDADPLQLRQVVLNVLTNAAQAIAGEGTITINAQQMTAQEEAVITIHDSGVGLASEAGSRVFEPLYTTKATGTGLGLSICKQIVESHQGRISLTSQPEQGTIVTIALPRV